MHFSTLLASLAASQLTLALPPGQQIFQSPEAAARGLISSVEDGVLQGTKWLEGLVDNLEWPQPKVYKDVEHTLEGFDLVKLAEYPDHQLRIKSTSKLCDPSVQQYSGYLDISDTKHLFFWFFESRNDPAKDPLMVWMNGE